MSTADIRKPSSAPKPQHQSHQPGDQGLMDPAPRGNMEHYRAAGKLKGKKAFITGGDSGIGRAIAVGFAKEGADVAILYLEEDDDAKETQELVEDEGRKCVLIKGDIRDKDFCFEAVRKAQHDLGGLNILVNNAAQQYVEKDFEDLDLSQMEETFRTNIFSVFYLTQAALKHMKEGDVVLNTASITAYHGHKDLVDYSSTKGAIVSFTRSLSQQLAQRKIRVNAVAPGPIWTPLIPSSFSAKEVGAFGKDTPMQRPGQPDEVAPCYIFLASDDASYITGQVIHPNGGSIVNA
jgi:NAD(P)-dependent dehydrogenase (short-subunit alcohol dehydrogenase family)